MVRLQHPDQVSVTSPVSQADCLPLRTQTRRFYPSNLSPLYSDCLHDDMDMDTTVESILALNETFLQPGGVPSSLTGQFNNTLDIQ